MHLDINSSNPGIQSLLRRVVLNIYHSDGSPPRVVIVSYVLEMTSPIDRISFLISVILKK